MRQLLQPVPLATPEFFEAIRSIVKEEISTFAKITSGEERLISPAEACKVFNPGISKVTLSNWTKAGYLKSYRVGGRIYYRRNEIIDATKSLKKYRLK